MYSKLFNKTILFIIVIGLLLVVNNFNCSDVWAFSAIDDDKLVSCDENGNNEGDTFTKATISIDNIDDSGNYEYFGVDVGIFKKPKNGSDWTTVYTKRIPTNSSNIEINDFGKMSTYEYEQVYVIGYRTLYNVTGKENQITATEWLKVDDAYFKVKAMPPEGDIVIEKRNESDTEGEQYTNNNPLTLSLPAERANRMYISEENNAPTASSSDWEKYKSTKEWEYNGSDGKITLYAWFMNTKNGEISEMTSDKIIYDSTPVSGTVTINNGDIYTTDNKVDLTFIKDYIADRDLVNVHEIIISNTSDFSDSKTFEYPADDKLSWELDSTTEGIKTVYAKYRDWAGNVSKPFNDSIIYTTVGNTFITCDEYGNIGPNDVEFSQATTNISNLDDSSNYVFYGFDIGTFKKEAQDAKGSTIYLKRIAPSSKKIKINKFGDISKYAIGQAYVIGYRPLYKIFSKQSSEVIEGSWKYVTDSYFTTDYRLVKNISHKQLIKYYYNNEYKSIEVSEPDKSGLTGDELTAYNNFNFSTNRDYETYKLRFEIPDDVISIIDKLKINLDFNTLIEKGVNLELKEAKLDGNNINFTKKDKNKYTITIDKSKLQANKEYCIEYGGYINISDYTKEYASIRNLATFIIKDINGSEIESENEWVETKLYKDWIKYN